MTAARFWLLAVAIALLRLALVSDLSIRPIDARVDDALYVTRAYHLLQGEAFGPYDAYLLVKHPGLSLWMAGAARLGIPYLLSVHVLYLLAGLYFVGVFAATGLSRTLLLGVFALHAFNPTTLDDVWFRVLREPLTIGLTVLIFGGMSAVLIALRRRRPALVALAVLGVAFALAILVREEDRLLYVALVLFDVAVVWHAWRWRGLRAWRWAAIVLVLPPALGLFAEGGMRAFVARHYGRPVLNDLHEGRFPGLIAAMRSADVDKSRRLVMLPREALGRLRAAVPSTAPVIDGLPPAGLQSEACRAFRVCDEWTNGWMIFWVKQAAFTAGLTPSLSAAQEYFGTTAREIRAACERGALACRADGRGLLPRFDPRWVSALLHEGRTFLLWTLFPYVTPPDVRRERLSPELARAFTATTLADLDPARTRPPGGGVSARAGYRHTVVVLMVPGILIVLVTGTGVVVRRMARRPSEELSPVTTIALIAYALAVTRLAALSYAAVYVGFLHPRFVASTYAVAVLIAGVVLVEAAGALRRPRVPDDAGTAGATIRA